MHRRMVLSETYQQASSVNADGLARDPSNELFGRFDRRRLSAEELRDSLLVVGDSLDRAPGREHPFPAESTWNYTQHNPFSTFFATDKRSIYLVSVRNRRHPFLGLFDGADPNATTPQRQVTTVPTQSLYFLNDPFFHSQADRLATRMTGGDRLAQLFRIAFQRAPTDIERDMSEQFLRRYGEAASGSDAWKALVRVLLANNEFLYLD